MTVTTAGIEVRARSRSLRDAVELISSMRFSISLLTVICIASVIGTVVKQHEPFNNYVNQFGPFWAEVFGSVGLYTVYSAWWFLLILAFLVAVDQPVHRAQRAEDPRRPAQLQGAPARAGAAGLPPRRARRRWPRRDRGRDRAHLRRC